jgi:hypothetical protein
MDNYELEQRIAALEHQLECFERRYLAYVRTDDPRVAELECKVQGLEGRLKDLDKVETLAFDAYLHCHPEAQEGILEIDRVVDMDAMAFYFQNLPTVKDAERTTHAGSKADAPSKENGILGKRIERLEYCLRHMLDRIYELGTTERIAKTLFAATDKATQDTLIQLGQFGCEIPGFLLPPQADGKGGNSPKS